MTDLATAPLSAREARTLTDSILSAADRLWNLLLEAHERKAWKSLGYRSWQNYVETEFAMTRQRAYQLLDHGRVIRAIQEASEMSNTFDISARDAADLKRELPEITNEIRTRVECGQPPEDAAREVIEARRVERNGKTYEQNTSNIGKAKQVAPDAPKEEASPVAELDTEPDPAIADDPDDYGPSQKEIADAEKSEAEQLAYIKKLLDSEDDPLTKALAKIKKLRAEIEILKWTRDGHQNKATEMIRMVKSLQAKIKRLERAA